MMSFYNVNLSLRFCRWIGSDNTGRSQYDTKNALMTSANYDTASALYQLAMSIIYDINPEQEIKAVLPCNNNTNLIFEFKPDQNNQMTAYLTIEKNNQTITFKFQTHSYKIKKDGQIVTIVIQSGLGVFAKTIDGYLTGVGADRHLNKMPDVSDEFQGENQQSPYSTGNGSGNQNANYSSYITH